MAQLKIKALGKQYITWGNTRLTYIRNVNATQNTTISFTNATGQTFTAGQVLFTAGNSGSQGYIAIKSKNAVTLNGNGVFELTVEHYPTSTAAPYQQDYTIDTTPTYINFTYNSKPDITDIEVETPNNTPYVFLKSDFSNHYSDFDGEPVAEIQVNGDTTGFFYNNSPYVAGTWIPISDIDAGLFKYVPLNQTAYYEKINTYKVKDASGNISIN
ncbi:hypothetical protein [uncultured Chryseobacterium sp.]|uniref:hypothetical protein n=1 Tax=uncultured Chryseobacterium sp. TaxID=259322 RepID=UPI0025E6FABF|nr:hypothetical protein [uncultured Chryseobacterium sp.]